LLSYSSKTLFVGMISFDVANVDITTSLEDTSSIWSALCNIQHIAWVKI